MTESPRIQRLAIAAVIACFGAIAHAADDATDGALIAPADAGVFVQIDNIAQLRGDWKVDPLGVYLQESLPLDGDDDWNKIQEMLGMDGDTIVDTFMGESVVIIAKNMRGGADAGVDIQINEDGEGEANVRSGSPGVVLMKVEHDAQKLAKEKLNLKAMADGKAGAYEMFHTEDDQGIIAFGPTWMAMGDANHASYIRSILKQVDGPGAPGVEPDASTKLAEQPDFKVWTGRLEKERFATIYARDKEAKEYHAAGFVRKGRDLTIDYAGSSPQMKRVFDMMTGGAALDFGPAPKQTIAALSLNLIDRNIDPRRTAFLDQMLAPKTFHDDVLQKISGPLVLSFAQVPADRVVPATDFPTPAIGLAVKLADPAVSDDIDRLIDSSMLFVNLAAANAGVEVPTIENVKYETHLYRSVNLGPLVAKASGQAEREGQLKLAYGRIGDWYVVTSHEVYFQQMLDAKDDPTLRLAAEPDFKAMPLRPLEQPIATGMVRTVRLASMIGLVEQVLSDQNPLAAVDAIEKQPESPMGGLIKGLNTMSTVLGHHTSISMQVNRGEGSGDYIEARVDFKRKK